MHEVVFVEPVPFASRLHVLSALVHGASSEGFNVRVVIASRASGADLDAFLQSVPAEVTIEIAADLPKAEPRLYAKLGLVLGLTRKAVTRNAMRSGDSGLTVVLTALDDYPRTLPLLALYLRLVGVQPVAIRYRVPDLVPSHPKSLKMRLRRSYFAWFRRFTRAQLVVFDERVPSNHYTCHLSDPWSEEFGRLSRDQARSLVGWPDGASVVLFVGFQDRRKGFGFSSEVLRAFCQSGTSGADLRVCIVGGISDDHRGHLQKLQSFLPHQLEVIDRYITDAELAARMSAADVVMLTYSPTFTSTSGVLSRASASKTPVLASDAGLVGWRVREFGLGLAVPFGDIESGRAALTQLLGEWSIPPRAHEYACLTSPSAVSKSFGSILSRSRL